MRIYINRRPVSGPWGGGSKILRSIVDACISRDHEVIFSEQEIRNSKVDIILCVDPRPGEVTYNDLVNVRQRDGSLLIQRIGDLGTHGKPDLTNLLFQTMKISDHLIFPSQWAKDQLQADSNKSTVILNGADPHFVKSNRSKSQSEQLRIVTHHWSDNVLKGFDLYQSLSKICKDSNDLQFTYIGRKPGSIEIDRCLPPMDVDGLVEELPKHDIYVTASKWEAGANHVLEAMSMGLPVLYHKDGGSIIEYCSKHGEQYETIDDLILLLRNSDKMRNLLNRISYNRTTKEVGKEYVDLMERLHEGKH